MKYLIFLLLTMCLILVSCSTKLCENREKNKFDSTQQPISEKQDTGSMKKVKVYKPDGTLQCNQGKQISLEEMQTQLKDIQVFSSVRASDGKMRIQLCGTPTGQNNVYEILESDLSKAEAAGFKVWLK